MSAPFIVAPYDLGAANILDRRTRARAGSVVQCWDRGCRAACRYGCGDESAQFKANDLGWFRYRASAAWALWDHRLTQHPAPVPSVADLSVVVSLPEPGGPE